MENILKTFEKQKIGLFFPAGGFYLDPQRPVEKAIISHAHADHASPGHNEIWCTRPTMEFMKARYKANAGDNFHLVNYGESFQLGNAAITLYPAGHMLGSAQILVEVDGVRYCYTGDFKLQPDSTCAALQPIDCDVLITETTFAEPGFTHPEEALELEKLSDYAATNLVIGVYSLGKAQRINSMISKRYPQRRVMIHPEIVDFHRVYENMGVSPGSWNPYQYRLFRRTKGNILLAPPKVISTWYRETWCATAIATGWRRPGLSTTFEFNISDHADWNELLTLIRLTKPKYIFTVHGSGTSLKQYFTEMQDPIKFLN